MDTNLALNSSSMDNYFKVTGNTANTPHNIAATNACCMRLNATAPEQGSSAARINEVEVYGN